MRIYYKNLLDIDYLTASSTKTNCPLSNILIPQLARYFSFNDNNGTITVDFGTETEIGACIIDKSNLTSSATVSLQANTSDSWDYPAWEAELEMTDTNFKLDLDQEYRYWRLVVSDTSLDYAQIGYFYLGDKYIQLPTINPEVDLYYSTTSYANINLSGQVYGDEGYRYLATTFVFPQIGEAAEIISGVPVISRLELLDFWNTVENINPFWVELWSNNLDEHPPYFCILNQTTLLLKKLSYGKYYSFELNLREVK